VPSLSASLGKLLVVGCEVAKKRKFRDKRTTGLPAKHLAIHVRVMLRGGNLRGLYSSRLSVAGAGHVNARQAYTLRLRLTQRSKSINRSYGVVSTRPESSGAELDFFTFFTFLGAGPGHPVRICDALDEPREYQESDRRGWPQTSVEQHGFTNVRVPIQEKHK